MATKLFLSLFVLYITSTVLAQTIQLENLTSDDKDSKTIYIGLDNKFKVNDIKSL